MTLEQYIEREILPRYEAFDAGHRVSHARDVIRQSAEIVSRLRARGVDVDGTMAYAAAAYHDLGLVGGRERHHLVSGEIVRADAALRRWFSEEQIEVIAQAVEDHRASAKSAPRSIYGRIVSEADRLIVPGQVIGRAVAYGLTNYPDLDREGQWERVSAHVLRKYGHGGYLCLWFDDSPQAEALERLRAIIHDDAAFRAEFDRAYTWLTSGE